MLHDEPSFNSEHSLGTHFARGGKGVEAGHPLPARRFRGLYQGAFPFQCCNFTFLPTRPEVII